MWSPSLELMIESRLVLNSQIISSLACMKVLSDNFTFFSKYQAN